MTIAIIPVAFDRTPRSGVPELYEVGGKSLLEHCITNLTEAGLREIVILIFAGETAEVSRIENELEDCDDGIIRHCRKMSCDISIWSAPSLVAGLVPFSEKDMLVHLATDLWAQGESGVGANECAVYCNSAWPDSRSRIQFISEMMIRLKQPVACVQTGAPWENALHSCAVLRSDVGHIVKMLEPETCVPLPDTLDVIRTAVCIPAGTLGDLVPDEDGSGRYSFQTLVHHLISRAQGMFAVPEQGRFFDARFSAELNAFKRIGGEIAV